MNDTILVRLDIPALQRLIENRLPDANTEKIRQIIDRTVASFQRHVESEGISLCSGEGYFETCFFEAQ
jgi:hypothetical protein